MSQCFFPVEKRKYSNCKEIHNLAVDRQKMCFMGNMSDVKLCFSYFFVQHNNKIMKHRFVIVSSCKERSITFISLFINEYIIESNLFTIML